MKPSYYVLVMLIGVMAYSCGSSPKEAKQKVINLSESLNQTEIIPLSEVAVSIEYIPLETSDEVLVGFINTLLYDGGYIYVKDNTGIIKIFDRNGRFVRSINRVGRGPQEYLPNSSLSLSPQNGNLLLTDYYTGIKEYSPSGNFIREFNPIQEIVGYNMLPPLMIDENRYIAPLFNDKYDREYCAVLFDSLSNIQQMISTPELYGREQPTINSNSGVGGETLFRPVIDAKMFRYRELIRIFYPETKEIFTTNGYDTIDTAYLIDYGKYRLPGGVINDYTRSGKYLSPTNFNESENYLFINVSVRNIFENPAIFMGYFLFDKRTMETRMLYDHEKKISGFRDDLQAGPPFWPKTIYGENTLISHISISSLIEYLEQNEVSEKLKNTMSNLSADDNPVVIFVNLK